ncbi:MAG: hypothetical protein K6A76_00420 [Oribacterium sp.]|nr:hypothetical protein [Oribacterium sp.]
MTKLMDFQQFSTAHGITDDTPDPVPELAYYVRKDGHLTGNSYETTSWPFLFDGVNKLTAEHEGFSFNMPCEVYFGGKSMTPKSAHLLAEGYEIMNGLTVPVEV